MKRRSIILGALMMIWVCGMLTAGENMIGPQSQNEGVLCLPAQEDIKIDGDLKDWDWSGRIRIIPHKDIQSQYCVELATMYDKDYFYLATKWKDPTPMYSTVNPDFNPSRGWISDATQLNFHTDQSIWSFTWFYTPESQPSMMFKFWDNPIQYRDGQVDKVYAAEPGETKLGDGIEMSYNEFEDGDGFIQEMRIPWKVLYKVTPDVKPGMKFNMGIETIWGDPTGNTWPVMRYADNMAQGHNSREFFWASPKPWGSVELIKDNNIEPRKYISGEGKIEGSIPLKITLPKKASKFTVVVESLDGKRIRNLGGDLDVEAYEIVKDGDEHIVEVMWDGLDDEGGLVELGSYKVRGLYHNGLDASYEMSFYNPGTPTWNTGNGKGSWGADHSAPKYVARSGDWMIAGWGFAEGGHGIIGLNPQGVKQWGEKRGVKQLTCNDKYVFVEPESWHTKSGSLMRLEKKKGKYAPFVKDGKKRELELPLEKVFGEEVPGKVADMVVCENDLYISFTNGTIALLDAESADLQKTYKLDKANKIAVSSDGKLYAHADGKIYAVDVRKGTSKALKITGFDKCSALDVDNDGNILIADMGTDMQIKAYTVEGEAIYQCGRKGGRGLRGAYDPMGMRSVSSIATDYRGNVWAAENWDFPRRISVWGQDGALIKEYIGNTEYSGTGCFLHETDPTIGYIGPMEVQLDKNKRDWKLTRILWVPDESKGETFEIAFNDHANGTRFTSDISGVSREYFFDIPYRYQYGYVIYMEDYGKWKPVSAITTVMRITGQLDNKGKPTGKPTGEFADLDPYDGVIWNDMNGDGLVQRSECEIQKTENPSGERNAKSGLPMGAGWGGRIGDDFEFYARGDDSLYQYKPDGFAENGAPIYSLKGVKKVDFQKSGTLVPVTDENRLLVMESSGNIKSKITSVNPDTSEIQWSYPNPYPGVHGSHHATMPKPGLVIGPLKIMGVAEVNEDAGKVFGMRGNLGQDFFITTDGLYVGALFQDGRLPGATLPDSEAQLADMPMNQFSEGGEPFNGWFGKQSDGKIRMTSGMGGQSAMILQIHGLNTIERFELPDVKLDAAVIEEADKANVARAAASEKDMTWSVERVVLNEKGAIDWKSIKFVTMKRQGQPFEGTCRMAYDDKNLYLEFAIQDGSPWKNLGTDFKRLFKTGDAVDLQLCVDPELSKNEKRNNVKEGDMRIVIGNYQGKPVAVLMKPFDQTASDDLEHVYHSSVTDKHFDRVEILKNAKVKVASNSDKKEYRIIATIPLDDIGLKLDEPVALRGDVGFILSDKAGTINTARVYWSNKDTNLVNDEPFESWMSPNKWRMIEFK